MARTDEAVGDVADGAWSLHPPRLPAAARAVVVRPKAPAVHHVEYPGNGGIRRPESGGQGETVAAGGVQRPVRGAASVTP
ncbi:hypothetical protein BIV23_17460 [Streptomyces monashensis]|uniref:Uncharacterized protein n=1 Tax=Streptomyces monashensis TaxID=1678012 RepID=A0A1S2QFQ3_9ACTN|nr:hypothetical protein BIV23_17460 [Streptomyces monashensis]